MCFLESITKKLHLPADIPDVSTIAILSEHQFDHLGALLHRYHIIKNTVELFNMLNDKEDAGAHSRDDSLVEPKAYVYVQMLRPIKHVQVNEMGDTITEVNERSKIAGFLFQGDIVLTDEQIEDIKEDVEEETSGTIRRKRQAYKDWKYPNTIWSKGVNYYFDYSATTDRIRVFREDGCWSYVGRRGREQDLSLGRGCESIATAAHELGHALGMFHTMSRHDRDRFITLYVRNIKANWLDQFARQTPHTNENYGITYDYGSIMHYGGTSASVNGRATMVPFDTNYQETLGSPFISFYDLLMMNTHYNCLVSNGKPGTEPEFTTTAPVTTTRTQTRVTTYPPRPTRVTTYPPRPVVVTMRPLPVVDGFFCVDSPSCVMLSRMGFCYSPQFPVPMKMAFCPKMCGFCQ
ncbi:shTK domain protein [Ancylostoma caninum]|uniref:Metalloendopeptidase n=1 Tax=Ancylostoma caninum TaxID=29170 RepID=A0A368GYU9_ANCCA|nr:shTK domain protein [Ancylostoma caninum]